MANHRVELTNQRFGRLLVIGPDGMTASGNYRWRCRCDCGTVTTIASGELRGGTSQSCGCLRRELARARHLIHGHYGTPEYRAWQNLKGRCYQPNNIGYHRYGGRGITVCEQWRASFEAFFAHVGLRPSARHSIDRIDVNGHYEPGNVRWATPREQQRNRSSNRVVTHNGRSMSVVEWAEQSGLERATLTSRLNKGWPMELALSAPLRKRPHYNPIARSNAV